jgi:hypothetical protein
MAKGQWLTPHQKGIVRRYYEHKDNLATQKLSEIVSDLYLCKDDKEAARLWQSAHTALLSAGVHQARADSIVAARDLKRLAKLVGELF